MLKKRWNIRQIEDEFSVKSLAETLNISEILANLLVARKITNFTEAKIFFRPSLEALHDPFSMHGMEQATSRIIEAITENQPIVIFGDYDVDGTCATAILYLFLKDLGANVDFYIPNRLTEGYGLSRTSVDIIKEKNVKLIITVDCGITAVEEAAYGKSLDIDFIICDHHQPKEELPDALAVLDPLKPGCEYPFKYLSGAGVAFKLAQGISERIGRREMPMQYLDLVALASSADIVPLIDENRLLVREGLNKINESPRPGIRAIIESASLQPGNLTSGQVVFTIAPRINAVGRLGDARRAVNLLISDNKEEAAELAKVLETENYERRKLDVDTFDHALQLVESTLNLEDEIAIVLHQEEWHPGVIGIVASRLVEKYYRPAIMLTTIDGIAKGSARSITNFNIYEALQQCEDTLIHFGGHKAAAGLAVEINKLDEFKLKFNQIVKETLGVQDLLPEINIDSVIKLSEITPKFIRILDQFSPFGPGNMRPVFLSEDVQFCSNPRLVGQNHILGAVKQSDNDKVFDCIGFNMKEYIDIVNTRNGKFDVVFSIDKTAKDGRTFPQLKLKDLKVKEEHK